MLDLPITVECRLSGEALKGAAQLFEIPDAPLPGIYPEDRQESLGLRTPLRVVQAQRSRLVQLAHRFNPDLYRRYAFAGATSKGYAAYLQTFAQRMARRFPPQAAILEVGCGDGSLVRMARSLGFADTTGIDPGLSAQQSDSSTRLIQGFFPQDLPPGQRSRRYDLIVLRHVLEHVEEPRAFVASLAAHLKETGELWIEVPDLESTVRGEYWSNFYQLHCNYFEAATLDALLREPGLECGHGEVVEVFGGSLLRQYRFGSGGVPAMPNQWHGLADGVEAFKRKLNALAAVMPEDCAGYGAAERTAVTLGFCPALEKMLARIYDGNPLLAGRFLAGTTIPIDGKDKLFERPPAGLLLFAISHEREILEEWKARLPLDVCVGVVGRDFTCKPLQAC